jgi:hypothetical protein
MSTTAALPAGSHASARTGGVTAKNVAIDAATLAPESRRPAISRLARSPGRGARIIHAML